MAIEHNDYLENIIKRYLNKNVTVDKTKVFKLNQCLFISPEERLKATSNELVTSMLNDINKLKKNYVIITNPYMELEKLNKVSSYYLIWCLDFIFINKKVKNNLTIEVPKGDISYWIGEKGVRVKYIAKKIGGLLNRRINVKIVGI